jgi:serine/threonine protein kinase/tetratricopeptide (TPR) repeat protein
MNRTDPLLNLLVGGRYQLLERLGDGGMGSVYKATQLSMDRLVAVKLIHPALAGNPAIAARFDREMQATARVEHPNTVQVFDYGQTQDGQLFLVMEMLQGCTLAKLLELKSWLSAERLIPIATQIVRALGAAHAKGIVHRDLKPENVMLVERFGERDFVKVLDFGIAHFLAGEPGAMRMTIEGSLIGTPAYMSPEQARGEQVGPRSDLYSLGVLLYQASLGLPPFDGTTLPEILLRRQTHTPRPPSEVAPGRLPASLEALIMWLLEREPEDRPADAEAVLAQLAGVPVTATAETQPNPEGTFIRPSGPLPLQGGAGPWDPPSPSSGREQGGLGSGGAAEGWRANPRPDEIPTERDRLKGRGSTQPIPTSARVPAAVPRDSVGSIPIGGSAPEIAKPPRQGRALRVVAVILVLTLALGAGGTALYMYWRSGAEDAAGRARLDQLMVADGDPLAPEACRAKAAPMVQQLLRSAQLLEGSTIDSRRPADSQALELLDDGAGAVQGQAEYWTLKGRAHLAAGSAPERARQAADSAARLCPGYALAHKLSGNALQRAGRTVEAKAAYQRALDAEPNYLAPTVNLGLIALKEKDTTAALAAFDRVLARKPGDFNTLLARSEARRIAGQSEAAIADLDAAARANPKSAEARLRKGHLLESMGRAEEARTAYCEARALGSAEVRGACP